MARTVAPGLDENRREQIFPVLSPALVARAAAYGTERSYEAGELLWRQGDEHIPFFVVLAGELEIAHPQGTSEDLVVVHEAGHFTGEVSMLSHRRALVLARAKGPLRVLRIEPDRFTSLVKNETELSEIILRAF